MKIINLTDSIVRIKTKSGGFIVSQPTGKTAKLNSTHSTKLIKVESGGEVGEVDLVVSTYDESASNLPLPQKDTLFIVHSGLMTHSMRSDLVMPWGETHTEDGYDAFEMLGQFKLNKTRKDEPNEAESENETITLPFYQGECTTIAVCALGNLVVKSTLREEDCIISPYEMQYFVLNRRSPIENCILEMNDGGDIVLKDPAKPADDAGEIVPRKGLIKYLSQVLKPIEMMHGIVCNLEKIPQSIDYPGLATIHLDGLNLKITNPDTGLNVGMLVSDAPHFIMEAPMSNNDFSVRVSGRHPKGGFQLIFKDGKNEYLLTRGCLGKYIENWFKNHPRLYVKYDGLGAVYVDKGSLLIKHENGAERRLSNLEDVRELLGKTADLIDSPAWKKTKAFRFEVKNGLLIKLQIGHDGELISKGPMVQDELLKEYLEKTAKELNETKD